MVLSNVALIALVGCGGGGGGAEAAAEGGGEAVDPQSVADAPMRSRLTPAERDLLLRGSGRTWTEIGPRDLESYLAPRPDSTSAAFVWAPNSGLEALERVGEACRGLDAEGVRCAVLVLSGGDDRAELVALRESQIVLPAYRVPRQGNYGFLQGGLPSGNTLIVSQAGGEGPAPFSAKTPVASYRPLLEAMAPGQ